MEADTHLPASLCTPILAQVPEEAPGRSCRWFALGWWAGGGGVRGGESKAGDPEG